jgi:hypothetical protein
MSWFITVLCLVEKMCKWPDGSVGRVMEWYFEDPGFESWSSFTFFLTLLQFAPNLLPWLHIAKSSIHIALYYPSKFEDKLQYSWEIIIMIKNWYVHYLEEMMCKQLNNSVRRAVVRYSECPGFESWSGCTFFSLCYNITNW